MPDAARAEERRPSFRRLHRHRSRHGLARCRANPLNQIGTPRIGLQGFQHREQDIEHGLLAGLRTPARAHRAYAAAENFRDILRQASFVATARRRQP